MIINDYQCQGCKGEYDFERTEDFIWAVCYQCFKQTEWKKIWRPPHTGRGSSGEPPR